MIKRFIIAAAVLLLIPVYGCSAISMNKSPSLVGPEIIRKAELAPNWQMYQLDVQMMGSTEFPILLKLNDGDRVDGYFYLETEGNLDFHIMGNSVIYKSEATSEGRKVTSGRFSFSATQAQGSTYTLSFHNVDGEKQTKATAFLEVIYPASGSIFTPLEAK